jgi:hypothetical protein
MEAAEIDFGVQALKQRLTVSYAEYRELEKTWMAARALVGGWLAAGTCNADTQQQQLAQGVFSVLHHCTQRAGLILLFVSLLLLSNNLRPRAWRQSGTICCKKSKATRRPDR